MIRVGPAGWSYADWEGTVYPKRKSRGFHPLRYLARFVDCVEINSTFYGAPRADWCERWVRELSDAPEFALTAKLQDVFTHGEASGASTSGAAELERSAAQWLEGIEPLRASGRLRAVLVQFPISFRRSPSAEARLTRIEGMFGHLPLVLEVRHRSWFEPEGRSCIQRLGYSLAHIDLPDAAEHPPSNLASSAPSPPLAAGPIGYVRLHGRNRQAWFDARAGRDQRYDYLYAPEELEGIMRVTEHMAGEVDEAFVITNNHFAGKAVVNALELLASMGEGIPSAPPDLVRRYPQLAGQVSVQGQNELFPGA